MKRKEEVEMPQYVVLHAVLSTKFVGGALQNVSEVEKTINSQAAKGYRLHTLTNVSAGETPGGIRRTGKVQIMMVFEKL